MIKFNKFIEIDKLFIIFKAKFLVDVNIIYVYGGLYILFFLFNMRGWLYG